MMDTPDAARCPLCGYSEGRHVGDCPGAAPQPSGMDWAASSLDKMDATVAFFAGLRARFMAAGFSEEAADALAVDASHTLTAQTAAMIHARQRTEDEASARRVAEAQRGRYW